MAQDLTIHLEDRPGTLAEVGEVLGKAGINIDGLCGFPSEGKGVLHVLVEDGARAKTALESAGVSVSGLRDVLLLEIKDRPGAFGETARKIANAGVNVNLAYLATGTRLVIVADDLARARTAL
ncbi:MAG TPA: ACT domain-containing protein [Anaerolineales bacterium]|nr:ACT domain-containing protein [Anaerolineales bacterium]